MLPPTASLEDSLCKSLPQGLTPMPAYGPVGSVPVKRPLTIVPAGGPVGAVQPPAKRLVAADPFGGWGREGYMQKHIHRKLHQFAMTLSADDLLALGRVSFNDQFLILESGLGSAGGLGGAGAAQAPGEVNMALQRLSRRPKKFLPSESTPVTDSVEM